MKKDAALKLIVFSILGLLILWLVSTLLFSNGINMNFRVNYGGEHMNMGNGYGGGNMYIGNGFGGTISLLLMLLIKVLVVVFVVALIVGLILVIKNKVFTPEDIATIKGAFASKNQLPKKVCDACGKELDEKWKACPYCGKEVGNTN